MCKAGGPRTEIEKHWLKQQVEMMFLDHYLGENTKV